jgi:hypothetical protein
VNDRDHLEQRRVEALERLADLGERREVERLQGPGLMDELRRRAESAQASAGRVEPRPLRRRTGHPREELPVDEVVKIEPLIQRRLAVKGSRRSVGGELSQDKITEASQLDRNRVQEAEKLVATGWDLLESHPDFSAKRGFVIWPKPDEALQILASRRSARTAEK